MRNRTLLTLALMVVCGCAAVRRTTDPQELLSHRVPVPSRYAWGKANPHFASSLDRYIYAYKSAWWACIEQHATNVNYRATTYDRAGNGWPAAVDGYWNGYTDAERRVRQLRSRFGPRQAQDILKRGLEYPE